MSSDVRILVDADACPVKDEIYRVAERHAVPVTIVSNSHIRVPAHPLIARQLVSDAFDAADDWIAEQRARLSHQLGSRRNRCVRLHPVPQPA